MEDVRNVYDVIKTQHNLTFSLKNKQIEVLQNVMEGKNVLAVLPTGYGKSILYALPPLFQNQVRY